MSEKLKADYSGHILRDLIDLPDPSFSNWYPETVGWKVLLVAGFIYGAVKCRKAYQVWKSNKYRRDALTQISELDTVSPYVAAQKLSKILKVTLHHVTPSESVYTMGCLDLVTLLNKSSENDVVFTEDEISSIQGRALLPEGKAQFTLDEVVAFKAKVILWVNKHKKEEVAQ